MPDPFDEDLPPPDGPGLFGDIPAAPPQAAPYRVLARKYRPATFDDLIGQDAMVRVLRRAFSLGRVAHAFMLTGVRGVGKTTTARIIARCLCCTGPDGSGGRTAEPCGVCPNCTAIFADRHPDVVEMDAASRTGVDDVREIIDATRFRPMQARAKVFIVDEVHMLSRNAFNALLKTLEEPPPHVTFIFATTELRKVPLTVLSRCQRFDLRRVSIAGLAAHFAQIAAAEGVAVAADALEMIARAADGSVRDGLSLLDQAVARGPDLAGAGPDPAPRPADQPISAAVVADMLGLADRGLVFDLLEAVMSGAAAEALAITAHAHERGADLGLLLGDLLELTHTLTRLRTVPGLRESTELPEAERTRGAALADRLSIPELGRAWQMLLKGSAEVEQATDRRASAEMVLIRLCHTAELPTPGELVRRLATSGQRGPGAADPASRTTLPDARPPAGQIPSAPPADPPPATSSHAAPAAPATGAMPPQAVAIASRPDVHKVAALVDPPRALTGDPPRALTGDTERRGETTRAPAGALPQARSQAAVLRADQGPLRADPDPAPVDAAPSTPDPVDSDTPPQLDRFRDVASLVAERQDPLLHAHLLHSVHLVRFAPPVIELRPDPAAPRDLAPRLAALLLQATSLRWTIALSTAPGEPTLAAQAERANLARHGAASEHPMVRAILDAFPGARIAAVHDSALDRYGLPAVPLPDPDRFGTVGDIAFDPDRDREPDMPDFAPPEAEPAETMPDQRD